MLHYLEIVIPMIAYGLSTAYLAVKTAVDYVWTAVLSLVPRVVHLADAIGAILIGMAITLGLTH